MQSRVDKKKSVRIREKFGINQVVILQGTIVLNIEATMTESEWKKTLEENPQWTEQELYNYMHGKAAGLYMLAMAGITKDNPIVNLWNNHTMNRMHFSIEEKLN